MLALFSHSPAGKVIALGLFLLATLTDLLDGVLARRLNQQSEFGALLDPIADKILVLAAFLSFVELKLIPAWMVVLIVSREFLVTGLRLVAYRQGKVLAAEKQGKHKTVSQMVAIFAGLIFLIVSEMADEWFAPGQAQSVRTVGWNCLITLMTITVVLTLTSGISFLTKQRHVFFTK